MNSNKVERTFRGLPGIAGTTMGLLAMLLLSGVCRAEMRCFLQAETYYEQVYCEVMEKGQGNGLPSYYDFSRNDETTQAFLLKRRAQRIGIDLAMPRRGGSTPARVAKRPAPERGAGQNGKQGKPAALRAGSLFECQIGKKMIQCGADQYLLATNRKNRNLSPGSLDSQNRMNMPGYSGNPRDTGALNHYLSDAYRHYIGKMLQIGLGAATMSFGKFAYFYTDATSKGVSFHRRFDTLYEYLKKDKRHMPVNETHEVRGELSPDDCDRLTDEIITCVGDGRNYLFLKE